MTRVKEVEESSSTAGGAQTLMRGLDLIEAASHETLLIGELAERLGLAKSTTYRLASALVERGYLAYTPRTGYRLGPKLLQLGFIAQTQADIVQVAREHLEKLSLATGDTTHLGVLDNDEVLYLDKLPGKRRIMISSRVGDRQPMSSTGLGKALMLDRPPSSWMQKFQEDHERYPHRIAAEIWHEHMRGYALRGLAFDLEENEDRIRCVAAPIRAADGAIVAAISVSSAAQYMGDDRMEELSVQVLAAAAAISLDLGYAPETPPA